jgi:S-adenosylmethionine-diacylgycerolhomoserine-N-methlytransferase
LQLTPVQRFYSRHARVYDLTRWTFLYGRRRAIELLALRPDSSVLEIGCGTGLNFRPILARLDPAKGRLVGLDFSEHMLRRAAKRVAAAGYKNVTLIQADAERLWLAERFDAILFAYSLSMIPGWEAVLDQAHEHLKPGGRLVIVDFGGFERWGPLGRFIRRWLELNHVQTCRPYRSNLEELFQNVQVEIRLGGYCFIVAGVAR